MDKEEPRGLKTGQIVIAVLVVASIASLAGWGWWNGAGPFREKSPPEKPAVMVDLLDGVRFMRADVAFEPFADFRIVSDWNKVGQRSSEWTGKELQSLAPYIKPSYILRREPARTREEAGKITRVNQEFTKVLTDAFFAAGFRALPYMTPEQQTVSALSYAQIYTRVKTARQDNLVLFQMETAVRRTVRVDLKKPALVDVNLVTYSSPTYVVEEKQALDVMREALRKDAENALRYSRTRDISHSADGVRLEANPEENRVAPPLPAIQE